MGFTQSKQRHQNAKTTRVQTRPRPINRRIFIAGISSLAGITLVGTTGCQNLVKRGQSPEGDLVAATSEESTPYIASVCKMAGLRNEKIEGLALVTGLRSTGSAATPGEIRNRLERDLKRLDLDIDVSQLLKSEETEIVFCRGFLPPGVRKGDTIDLEVQALRDTVATSLDGGFTLHTRLHDTAKLGNTIKKGHLRAVGRGRVLTDATFETRDDLSNKLQGVILGGGRANVTRNLTLIIRQGNTSIRTATNISGALNKRFTVKIDGSLQNAAEAKNDHLVELRIPDQYRHNVGRYAQVVSNLAYTEEAHQRVNRLQKLGEEMSDPVAVGLASVRLESIGREAVPTLIRSLKSPLAPTRFYAAQALAYLGKEDGVSTLRDAAANEPAFRWHALTALTTLASSQSEQAILSLFESGSAETRYGAFRALRIANPSHPLVQGQRLADDHYLCVVDSTTAPLLHFSRRDRAEIVVFNDTQTFSDQFLYVESGLTVKSNGDGTVSVANYSTDDNSKTICSDRVSDVLQTIAQSGHGYATLLRLSRQAMKEGTLNSRLAVDAMPKAGRQYTPDVVQNTSEEIIKDTKVAPASWWSSVKERFAR